MTDDDTRNELGPAMTPISDAPAEPRSTIESDIEGVRPELPHDASAVSEPNVGHSLADNEVPTPDRGSADSSAQNDVSRSDATTDSADLVTLAAEIAAWTPPWQRSERSDTPPDEPVDDSEALQHRPADAPSPSTPRQRVPAPDPLPLAENLLGTIEAILLVCEEPVSEIVLAQTLGRPEPEILEALRTLAAQYTGDNRGFDLRRQAGGWRYYTREEFAPFVERFVLDGQQVRLTKAALETLSVVAYKQPVTRGRISAIRGVNCDGVIRTLTMRGLIEECGADPDSGAHLYRTTSLFLEKLGLNSLAELPPLAPFLPDDITQIGESSEN